MVFGFYLFNEVITRPWLLFSIIIFAYLFRFSILSHFILFFCILFVLSLFYLTLPSLRVLANSFNNLSFIFFNYSWLLSCFNIYSTLNRQATLNLFVYLRRIRFRFGSIIHQMIDYFNLWWYFRKLVICSVVAINNHIRTIFKCVNASFASFQPLFKILSRFCSFN